MSTTALSILAIALMIVGAVGIIVPALPGIPLMFAGMVVAAAIDDFQRIGWITLSVLGFLTVFSVIMEFAAAALGAKRIGASKQAIWGALFGTVVGIFFGIPGLLLGPFAGAVIGELADGKDALDLLAGSFPGGSITGAPKIRAMQIIDELEPLRRGLYGGCVGYIDFAGNLDAAIAIRTGLIKDGTAYVQAGAGLVADSVPEREDEEASNKAATVLRAVTEASRLVRLGEQPGPE